MTYLIGQQRLKTVIANRRRLKFAHLGLVDLFNRKVVQPCGDFALWGEREGEPEYPEKIPDVHPSGQVSQSVRRRDMNPKPLTFSGDKGVF